MNGTRNSGRKSNLIDQAKPKNTSKKATPHPVDFVILPMLGGASKCKFPLFVPCKMIGALGCRKKRPKFSTNKCSNSNPCM